MFARFARQSVSARAFSTSASAATKVTILGAAGGIGQPLSLLMKLNEKVSSLSLYDIVNAPGVAADVSHINTKATVTGYTKEQLNESLEGADIVLVPAGVPRKPGMTRDDLFNTNASIVRDLAKAIADVCPTASIGIIANPVNSTVPIVAEVLKKKSVFDPRKLFGITTLDCTRASRFVSQLRSTDPKDEVITVVGGHSGVTIVPLLSQSKHKFEGEELEKLVHRIQFGGDEVVQAKNGTGSATLSMAYAAAHFSDALLRAAAGEANVIEPAFVKSDLFASEGVEYFSSPIELGPQGVKKIHGLGDISPYEEKLVKEAIAQLKGNISKGVKFVSDTYN